MPIINCNFWMSHNRILYGRANWYRMKHNVPQMHFTSSILLFTSILFIVLFHKPGKENILKVMRFARRKMFKEMGWKRIKHYKHASDHNITLNIKLFTVIHTFIYEQKVRLRIIVIINSIYRYLFVKWQFIVITKYVYTITNVTSFRSTKKFLIHFSVTTDSYIHTYVYAVLFTLYTVKCDRYN